MRVPFYFFNVRFFGNPDPSASHNPHPFLLRIPPEGASLRFAPPSVGYRCHNAYACRDTAVGYATVTVQNPESNEKQEICGNVKGLITEYVTPTAGDKLPGF